MTTADQLSLVSRALDGRGQAVALAEGGRVQGWMKARRLLALAKDAERQKHHAVLVFSSTSFPPLETRHLTLELVLPLDERFRCEIDSGEAVLLKMTTSAAASPVMFEMLPGYHTQNFVSEIFRQSENSGGVPASGHGSAAEAFAWAKPAAVDGE